MVSVILKWRTLLSGSSMRWSLAAHDICFTNTFHSYFFMLGKCIPVVRGKGVFQVTNIENTVKGCFSFKFIFSNTIITL